MAKLLFKIQKKKKKENHTNWGCNQCTSTGIIQHKLDRKKYIIKNNINAILQMQFPGIRLKISFSLNTGCNGLRQHFSELIKNGGGSHTAQESMKLYKVIPFHFVGFFSFTLYRVRVPSGFLWPAQAKIRGSSVTNFQTS